MAKISELANQAGIEKVGELIKPALRYDEKNERWIGFRRSPAIIGTHGTHVDSIVKLAENGSFPVRPRSFLPDFYMTANVAYKGWKGTRYTGQVEHPRYQASDAYVEAIDYALNSQGNRDDDDYYEEIEAHQAGVVVVFGPEALTAESEIADNGYGTALELIMPQAPPLEAVRGIYPVERSAADMLMAALQELRK